MFTFLKIGKGVVMDKFNSKCTHMLNVNMEHAKNGMTK